VLAALLVVACGHADIDKAGGTHATPRILTIANGAGQDETADGPRFAVGDLTAWADEVTARSHGTLRFRFLNAWRSGQRNFEAGLIRDVRAGRADLGAVGTRAWDAAGVTSFDALDAPFVIDSYPLEEDVLQSAIPDRMLTSLRPLGLTGLGVVPGPLRRPLSAARPLRAPTDFSGLRIGYQGESGPAEALRALGATPVALDASATWRGIDAIEQQVSSIDGNGYDTSAKYLTANVVLWPRPVVLFINAGTFARLTLSQRTALTSSAHPIIAAATAKQRDEESVALSEICQRGITLVTDPPADLHRLQDAVAPVLARLRRNLQTRSFLDAIGAMRRRLDAPPTSLACTARAEPSTGVLPDGDYTTTLTHADAARELARLPRRQRTQAGLSPDSVRDVLTSRYTLSLKAGTFVLHQHHADGHQEVGIQGTYSLFRDHFIGKGSNGDTLRARWAFDGANLRFSDFSFPGAYRLVWASEPWIRSP
jgi:TRAP-type C4-dicarboxylate transport system substrate-binding protein